MNARTGSTVVLTALSGPLGAVAAGAALARIADATQGGMAGLAAGVVGLFVGGPILAFAVFVICAFALARPRRRGVAIACMLAACIVDGVVILIGLVVTARSQADAAGVLALGALSAAVLGAGAWLALKAADRQSGGEVNERTSGPAQC